MLPYIVCQKSVGRHTGPIELTCQIYIHLTGLALQQAFNQVQAYDLTLIDFNYSATQSLF